jgi:hypothetical protein
MTKTDKGTAAAIGMAESKTKVSFKISNGKSGDGGSYAKTKGSKEKNDDGTYKTAAVTFFKGEF